MTEIQEQTIDRRAVDAAIWGLPLVSVYAMRQAYFRDVGASYNDVAYWSKPSNWKAQFITPSSTTYYTYFNYNIKNGPVVVEVPPTVEAGLFGTIFDAWQIPLIDVGPKGEDEGKGGKYLILPPGFKGDVPSGYFVIHSLAYNGYAFFRFSPKSFAKTDVDNTIAMMKKMRIYSLADAGNPPEQHFIDMADKLFDCIMRFDETFYFNLAEMINEELVQEQDKAMMGLLLPLGIEKGKDFNPDAAMQGKLAQSAGEAHKWLMSEAESNVTPFWPNSSWAIIIPPVAMNTAFSFKLDNYLDVDTRAIVYFEVCGGVKSPMLETKATEPATFYLVAFRDANGNSLRGEENYMLHVPANVPTKLFWSISLYDRETCGFIREMPRAGLDSYDQKVAKNEDGSVDIYIGPKSPAGKEANWVQTVPGREWFPYFRLYGPEKPFFDKTWVLPAINRVD